MPVDKKPVDTEQCPDDNKTSEENEKSTLKKEQDQIRYFLIPEFYFTSFLHTRSEKTASYPPGFSSKPFMPPRQQ